MTKLHDLKTWPDGFSAVRSRSKRYEIRRQDRAYKVGDFLLLREWRQKDLDRPGYTGASVLALVTFMTVGGDWGLPDDLCVMSIEIIPDAAARIVLESRAHVVG